MTPATPSASAAAMSPPPSAPTAEQPGRILAAADQDRSVYVLASICDGRYYQFLTSQLDTFICPERSRMAAFQTQGSGSLNMARPVTLRRARGCCGSHLEAWAMLASLDQVDLGGVRQAEAVLRPQPSDPLEEVQGVARHPPSSWSGRSPA